jgi:hypothetical protein
MWNVTMLVETDSKAQESSVFKNKHPAFRMLINAPLIQSISTSIVTFSKNDYSGRSKITS